jgi:Pentapeptide repeats (8 copies)
MLFVDTVRQPFRIPKRAFKGHDLFRFTPSCSCGQRRTAEDPPTGSSRLGGLQLCGPQKRGSSRANLSGADLSFAQLIQTDLCGASLAESHVYGASVWDIKVDDQTKQQNLVITPYDEAVITVDNIEVAQIIYLLLNNKEIRKVIDTITSKAVLILGRFSEERKRFLDALRGALRDKGFLPIVFDFERPKPRDFTETIMTLAGMSCFIIADITNPKSAPLELQATVPNYMIPFVPILQDGEPAFSMFLNLQTKYHWFWTFWDTIPLTL